MGKLNKLRRPAAILILVVGALATYLMRGGFRRFEITPYPVPPAAVRSWKDVLGHPRGISMGTLQTGVVHMDACLNLDPDSPRQAECDHVPRDLAVLVHWIRHPDRGDFLIDAGFDDSFAKHPPYGNYTDAMILFNRANGVTNRQEPGADLAAQLARLNIHPQAVFFTHLHPDHTGGVPGRHDIDESQELNYRVVMQAIADLGFTGFVSHEYSPEQGHDAIAVLQKAIAICDV